MARRRYPRARNYGYSPTPSPKGVGAEEGQRAVIEWPDVKQAWLESMEGGDPIDQGEHRRSTKDWKSNQSMDWIGGSLDEAKGWVRKGYMPVVAAASKNTVIARDRPRLKFSEEGELDLLLAWSGHDYPYLEWEQRKSKPGVNIIVEQTFSSSVSSKVITEYGAWVAGILKALEMKGYDMEVIISNPVTGMTEYYGRTENIIRVKERGKLSAFQEWSALFSPIGFRMLMFTAMAMVADKLGQTLQGTYGFPAGAGWGVKYEKATKTVRIGCANASTFPREQMDAEFNAHNIL